MTIIVEDGTGVVNANSYVTVAEYEDYAEPRGVVLPATESDKERQLILAMDYLEIQPWKGATTYPLQSLAWPRDAVYLSGALLEDDVIPQKIKFAQMQLAIQVNAGVDLIPTVTSESVGAVVREKVGPIETEYSSFSNVGTQPYFASIRALLAPYLQGLGFGQFRATRG